MDSMSAFLMGEANRDKELMVFYWDKAAQFIKERNAQSASAGLAADWKAHSRCNPRRWKAGSP